MNRNKESVTLDFKTPKGREVLDALIERADVLVENFRPGTLDRLGLGYTDVRSQNPRLVYVSISGFGQTGPRRQEPGYDAAIQAEGGLMSITGDANGPGYRLGVAIADITAGMFAAYGTSLALFARQRSNQGQLVDVGMLDSVAALLTYQAGIHFATDGIPERLGNRHPTVVPYETFEATDGEFVLAVGNDALWRKFCSVAGLEEIVADPRFATNRARVQAYDELRPLLERVLRTRSRQTWIEDLTAAGVPCGDVRNIAQVLADPQLAAREMVVELEHMVAGKVRVLGIPTKLSETPGTIKKPPPALGEHTDKVLEELLDIDQAERSRLRRLGAI